MTRPRLFANALLFAVFLFVASFFLWASLAQIDQVTRAHGRVIPSSQIQVIQNLEGGIVREILVKTGDRVMKGDILVRLDPTQFDSDFKKNRSDYMSLRAEIVRLTAESNGADPVFDGGEFGDTPHLVESEISLYRARKASLEADIDLLNIKQAQRKQELLDARIAYQTATDAAATAQDETKMLRPLVEKGIEPRLELMRAEQRQREAEGGQRQSALAIDKADQALEEVQLEIDAARKAFRSEALKELADAQAKFSRLIEAMPALEDRLSRTEVRAPMDGTINRVLVATTGGVVQPGMPLVELVPADDSLIIEAEVKPADIAFLSPGQKAKIRITAYDFSRYGSLEGELETIGADAVLNDTEEYVYLVKVRTEATSYQVDGSEFPILPGMIADVDILNGKRTVLAYLFAPALKIRERAFREL